MKNIVGQTPRGKDFYPRTKVIRKIYRRLDSGSHIFMSAPRRAGKTSIMRFLEDEPKKGYVFLYVSVEDIESSEEYFKILSEELLASEAVGRMVKASEKAYNIFEQFSDHIKKVKVWNIELESQDKEPPKYSSEFEKLMRTLDTSDFTIVLLVDEFPIALERINTEYGEKEAVEFLHANRSIRQRAKRGIQFIYTGSIGLPNITRKLKATATINDLNIIEVPPLNDREAMDFTKILLSNYKVTFIRGTIKHMLDRLSWLIPFFIQLVVQMLIDEFETNYKPITKDMVDEVLEKASNHRNNIYFENYYSRLDKSLTSVESSLAKQILLRIAEEDKVALDAFSGMEDASRVLEILEFDGYINSLQDAYVFNSPILQLWWKKYAKN
jgi:uncharacterized protein